MILLVIIAVQGIANVTYNGYSYATMDGCGPRKWPMGTVPAGFEPKPSSCSTCQSQGLELPEGWELALYGPNVVSNVVANNAFGTWGVVFSNGDAYNTAGNTMAPGGAQSHRRQGEGGLSV
jgi:hypothetical protein